MGAATGGGPAAGLPVADGVGVGDAVDGDGEGDGVARAVGEGEAILIELARAEAENASAGCAGTRVPAMTAAAARTSSLLNDEGL